MKRGLTMTAQFHHHHLTVGAALPVLIARLGGNTGAQFRAQAGALSGYVLDSLRGLREVLQYHQAKTAWQGWRSAQKACCTPRNA